jgi:hypothetical protein
MNFLSEDSITHWISPTHPEEASNFEDIKPCMDCHLKLTRGKLTEAEV